MRERSTWSLHMWYQGSNLGPQACKSSATSCHRPPLLYSPLPSIEAYSRGENKQFYYSLSCAMMFPLSFCWFNEIEEWGERHLLLDLLFIKYLLPLYAQVKIRIISTELSSYSTKFQLVFISSRILPFHLWFYLLSFQKDFILVPDTSPGFYTRIPLLNNILDQKIRFVY